MTGALFLVAFLGLPLLGIGPLLWMRQRWMPAGAAGATACAVGAVTLCGEMFALTALGIPWSLPLLLAGPVLLALAALYRRPGRFAISGAAPEPVTLVFLSFLLIAVAAIAGVAFAAMTARVTSSDLLLFWGAKGEHFGLARAIDVAFLRTPPDHRLLHPDYPPMWTCLFGFGTLVAGRLPWGATLATLPLWLALSASTVWSFARRRLGAAEAMAFTAIYASLFGFLLCESLTAGNADPALLFFETLALSLLIFAREEPGAFLLAGVALAGASWLKLEGMAFSWALIVGSALAIRPMSARRLAALSAPPLAAFGTWLAFCRSQGLIDTLGADKTLVLTAERFAVIARGMLSAASLHSFYVPWVVVLFLLVLRRTARAEAFAILVAALVAAFDCSIYLTSPIDPTIWIGWAGERTLLTPLLALLMAGMAPASRSSRSPERLRAV